MRLSVVIPCRDVAATIGSQLAAFCSEQWPDFWELIVSDNGSTDGTLNIVKTYQGRMPRLRVVDASHRRGRAYACNVGAAAAEGEAILFCDADDEIAPGWLTAMGLALQRYDCVACRFDFEKLNEGWAREMVKNHRQQRGLQKAWYPPYLPHAGGGGLGVKKWLHEAVGGLDDSLMRLADTDYCFRLQLKGVSLHFVSDAVIHIRCRHDFKGIFHQARLWSEYNILMYKRYGRVRKRALKTELWFVKTTMVSFIKGWMTLLTSAPQIGRREHRAVFMWRLGWQVGRVIGSVKHSVLPI